jgi:hypothetical protein
MAPMPVTMVVTRPMTIRSPPVGMLASRPPVNVVAFASVPKRAFASWLTALEMTFVTVLAS